jgi:hypothetical protein
MTVHVATSSEIAEAVRRGCRVPVRAVSDNPLVGPCSLDPETHSEQRCRFWGLRGGERAQFRASFRKLMEAAQSDQQVLVWTSRLWSDTVALWGFCAWRLHHQSEAPGIGLIVLGEAHETGFGCGSFRLDPADTRRAQDRAQPLPPATLQEMARRWQTLTEDAPVLASRGEPIADLAELGAYQAAFFPRMSHHGFSLSRFDDLLFSCVDEQGATPAQVFLSRTTAGDELRRWMPLVGDVFLAMRLRQWAEHSGAAPALTSEPEQPEHVMKAARYRLSDYGRTLWQRGLAGLAQGAPLSMWGCTAYDSAAPWVVTTGDTGESFRRAP